MVQIYSLKARLFLFFILGMRDKVDFFWILGRYRIIRTTYYTNHIIIKVILTSKDVSKYFIGSLNLW
jgi:hypothetical protein